MNSDNDELKLLNFQEFAIRIIKERINDLNRYCSQTENIFKISKIFIIADFIVSIQKELIKNKDNLFKYVENEKINYNFEKSFLLPLIEYPKKYKNEFYTKPYVILYKYNQIISDMFYTMSYNQKKQFLKLHSFMKHCQGYESKSITKSKKHSYKDYIINFKKGIELLIFYDSYITNEDIINTIKFIAFQMDLTKNSEWKSWNDIYEYCERKSFGFIINTIEGYTSFKNNTKPSYKDLPSYIEEGFLTFDMFMSFLLNILSLEAS